MPARRNQQTPGAAPYIQGYYAAAEHHAGYWKALEPPDSHPGHRAREWRKEWNRGVSDFYAWLSTEIGKRRCSNY